MSAYKIQTPEGITQKKASNIQYDITQAQTPGYDLFTGKLVND
jgi:hypothetical protein